LTASSRALVWPLVIVLAGIAGYFAYGLAQRPRDGIRAAAPGELSAQVPAEVDDMPSDTPMPARRVVPERLPDVSLPDMFGTSRRLSQWADRPLLVNFWATWCEPCRREIPLLKKLRTQHADQRLEVVGIAVDFREAVLKYANDIGIDYPVLVGEQEGLDAIGLFGMEPVFPFSVFADRSGRIVAIRVGELHEDEADFILAQVRQIDAGQLDLSLAKRRIAEKLRDLAVQRANLNGSS
jgi:thiol-disulfide isomerase/thioredoxin